MKNYVLISLRDIGLAICQGHKFSNYRSTHIEECNKMN